MVEATESVKTIEANLTVTAPDGETVTIGTVSVDIPVRFVGDRSGTVEITPDMGAFWADLADGLEGMAKALRGAE